MEVKGEVGVNGASIAREFEKAYRELSTQGMVILPKPFLQISAPERTSKD